jgi:peptidoglycan/xylan/chitin deacetylase (PgdA/CDA1 family)
MRQGLTVDDAFKVFKEQFDWLYRESEQSGRFMNIGLHPHVIGQPHRIAALREFLEYVKRRPNVWLPTREQIATWYLGEAARHMPSDRARS